MANTTYPAVRHIAVGNRLIALWDTVIGKKVVMAITGVVLILFVIAHMIGNLKIFSGPNEINAYSRFLREVGSPALAYGQLLWVVRIVLLACVALHITAAVQLSRMSWAARPVGYQVKRNIETTLAARTMRWGGVLLVAFVIFHLLHLTAGVVGFRPGQFKISPFTKTCWPRSPSGRWRFSTSWRWARSACTSTTESGACCKRSAGTPPETKRQLKILSRVIAIVVFVGFASVPVAVMAGWLH